MNPDNNNPTVPGAGVSPTPSNAGLSMTDGLASAQDNLTSAGMAADDGSSVMGLDAISAAAPEAVMTPPVEEPLIPAAPVPGSIGSVTSVPPLDADPASAVPPVPPADMMNPAAPAMDANSMPATEQPAAAPYNPFMQPAAAPATDSAVPADNSAATAPVPPVAPKAKPSLLTIIALVMDGVLLITTIVFAILFVNANNKKPETIYVPSDTGATVKKEVMTCTREAGFGNYIGGDASTVIGTQTLVANYADGVLTGLSLNYAMPFADEVTADMALNNFNAEQAGLLTAIEGSFGVDSSIDGGNLDITIMSGSDNLTDANAALLMYGLGNEQASVTLDAVRTLYEGVGYTCNVSK